MTGGEKDARSESGMTGGEKDARSGSGMTRGGKDARSESGMTGGGMSSLRMRASRKTNSAFRFLLFP